MTPSSDWSLSNRGLSLFLSFSLLLTNILRKFSVVDYRVLHIFSICFFQYEASTEDVLLLNAIITLNFLSSTSLCIVLLLVDFSFFFHHSFLPLLSPCFLPTFLPFFPPFTH